MITTRSAEVQDATAMVELLNEIIISGGTTAHETPYSVDRMIRDYIEAENGISCVVAESRGDVVGFQSLEWPYEGGRNFPDNWAIIATFVKLGMNGAGIGAELFMDTEMVAANSGVDVIDATIRADNVGGLKYYSKMGFTDYEIIRSVPLSDGTTVDRICKRFDVSEA